MYVGRDFSPAEQDESLVYGLDFAGDLGPSEHITSATWTLIVRMGADPTPEDHLIGGPTLSTPTGTTVQSATTQRIAGLLPDVTYTARAVVGTNQGNTLSLWSHIQGEPVE